MNDYSKMASEDYNKHTFEVKDGHIQEIKIIWCREDVIQTAKNRDIELTDDEVDEILYCLVNKHDAELGLSWLTIECWIDEVVNERKEEKIK